jgi:two-component system sensor histidine kinase PilS (NtrC family)
MLIVFQDLSELRQAESELKRADHLAALGRLSAQLAHEIRNPLAAMRGSAQMLAQDARPEDSSHRLANILVREADRLSHLVEDFLRFARPPPPVLREASLSQLVSDTIEMLRADPLCQRVHVELELEPVLVEMDADQLRQVLINLLRNALAAAGTGGTVRVTVRRAGGRPEIRIWDSAGSIPQGNLERIFEPFYTTKPGGTGLGLSTAHSIVRAHGGAIRVSSNPAQGTEFVVGLPSAQSETERAHPGGR